MNLFCEGNTMNMDSGGVDESMRPEVITFPEDIRLRAMVQDVAHYPYHWHNALEIIYVLQGQASVDIGPETHLLKENEISVINADEIHRIDASGRANKLLLLQVDTAFYKSLHPDYQYSFIYCCSPYHEAKAPEKYDRLKAHIAGLVCELNEKPCNSRKEDLKDCLAKMLFYMAYSFDYFRFGPGIRAFDEKQVKRIRKMYAYILKSPPGKSRLKDLAEKVDINLYHLSHDIKDKFGHTFQELLHYSRGEQAAKLLLSTDKRIAKISAESGFSDPKYLIKYFKLNYRCTPSQFRNTHRADDKTLASQMRVQEYPLSEALEYLKVFLSNRKTGVK